MKIFVHNSDILSADLFYREKKAGVRLLSRTKGFRDVDGDYISGTAYAQGSPRAIKRLISALLEEGRKESAEILRDAIGY